MGDYGTFAALFGIGVGFLFGYFLRKIQDAKKAKKGPLV